MKLRTSALILIVFCITFYTSCSGKNTPKDNEQTTSIQTSENTDISVSPNLAEPATVNENLFYGEWVISKVIASSPISAYTTEEAEQLVGINIVYSKDLASYDGEELKNPYYKKEVLTREENDNESDVSFNDLGIDGDSVVSIEIYENNEFSLPWITPASNFYVNDNNTLIMTKDGKYFELTRN